MPSSTVLSPFDIATAVLEIISEAVLDGDFDAFAGMFQLPLEMALRDRTVPIGSTDELRNFFWARHDALKASGVTKMSRVCLNTETTNTDQIIASHVGTMMKGDQQISEPQPIYSVLTRIDGTWKVTANQCGVAEADTK